MDEIKKTTALEPAVGAAAEQSQSNMYTGSITDPGPEINCKIKEDTPPKDALWKIVKDGG